MPLDSRLTRRRLLAAAARAAGALALPTIVPASALGLNGTIAPSNRVELGFVGLGTMGQANLRSFLNTPGVQVTGLCDVDWNTVLYVHGQIIQPFYNARGAKVPYIHSTRYFQELLDVMPMDAVVISTPDHWHALVCRAALRAGRDVWCEKPLTLTVAEGVALRGEVARAGGIVQVGSWQRSVRAFRHACELVRNGRVGELRRVNVGLARAMWLPLEPAIEPPATLDYEMWLGPAPWQPYTRHRTNWFFRWNFDFSGGMVTDWGAHHLDIAHWALGCDDSGPREVWGRAEFPRDGLTNTPLVFDFHFRYANGVELHCNSGFENGIEFVGSEGTVFVSREELRANPASLAASVIGPNEQRLYRSDNHYDNFLECLRSRREPVAPFEVGHRSATACHLANIAMRLNRKLIWDPVAERFERDDEANRLLSRAMRSPWEL